RAGRRAAGRGRRAARRRRRRGRGARAPPRARSRRGRGVRARAGSRSPTGARARAGRARPRVRRGASRRRTGSSRRGRRARRFSRTHSSKSASHLTVFVPGCYALAVMSVELYRRARRAEARSARAPERRRLRLEFFRQALAEGYDSLKVRHAEGASGQESVRTHARLMDDCVAMARTDFPSRTSMQEARFLAGERRLFARFQRVLRENVFRRDFGQFLETTLVERDARYRKHGASPYIGEPNVKESAGGL